MYLVESIHLESKSVDAGHAAYRTELGQFGSKVGIKRHILEILIRHFRLVSVLEKRGVTKLRVRSARCHLSKGKPEASSLNDTHSAAETESKHPGLHTYTWARTFL